MSYNYEIAKQVLSDTDKNRILCLYLNCTPNAIDWTKATADFGAASVESMRVMARSALKKIENAGGKEGVAASTTTPVKGSGGVKGRKRKGGKGVDDDDDDEETPTKKAKGGRKAKGKKEDTPVEKEEDAESGSSKVKEEEHDADEGDEVGQMV